MTLSELRTNEVCWICGHIIGFFDEYVISDCGEPCHEVCIATTDKYDYE